MTRLSKRILSTAIMTGVVAVSGCAEAGPGPDMKEADVKRIVKEYILDNPEIIREALILLQEKEEAQAEEDGRKILVALSDSLRNDPRDIKIGPADAKVTIVEFFDYNCGFCKQSTEWLQEVMDEHKGDVRVIFKETPVLDGRSKTSRYAAKAALAAGRQGKYTTLHFSLMKERSLSKDRIRKIVEKAGVDMKKFDKDMADKALDQQIDDTLRLANQIPQLTGTPFFMINDEYVSGADTARLQSLLDAELKS